MQIVVNRIPVIKETEPLKEDENSMEPPDFNMLTPMSTPGRRRSSAMSQISIDLSPIGRCQQKVEPFCTYLPTYAVFPLIDIKRPYLEIF